MFYDVLQLCEFFYTYLLKQRVKREDLQFSTFNLNGFYLKLKNIFMFLTRSLSFLIQQMAMFTTFFQRCPTFFNVVNSKVDVYNIVSTLIWPCLTSWCHTNLRATMKQSRNVSSGSKAYR